MTCAKRRVTGRSLSEDGMSAGDRKQLLIDLQYKKEPWDHPVVRTYLELGWRVAQLQRVSDGEAVVTLEAPSKG